MGEGLNFGKTYGVRIKLWKKHSQTYFLVWPTKMDGWQKLGRRMGKGAVGALVFQDIFNDWELGEVKTLF